MHLPAETIYLIISLIVLSFLAIRMLVAWGNTLPGNHLVRKDPTPARISVLIPARNEAHTIGNLLEDIRQQELQAFEIIVYDDQSEDQTLQVLEQYQRRIPNLRVLNGETLPAGWLGKNHACHHLAKAAKGEILLFIDSDVRLNKYAFQDACSTLLSKGLALLSVFPKQRMETMGERWVVPLMHWILLSLLPLRLIRKSGNPAFSAANGQWMMFDARVYHQYAFHELEKNQVVEDIRIQKRMKAYGLPVQTFLSDGQIECRMYTNYNEAINGFVKNVKAFFGGSSWLMLLFTLISSFGFLPVLLTDSGPLLLLYLIMAILLRVFVSIGARQSVLTNLMLGLFQQLSFMYLVIRSIHNNFTQSVQWKGRTLNI